MKFEISPWPWQIGTKAELSIAEKTDDKIDYLSEWYKGDEHGTQESNIVFTIHTAGAMSILDKNNYEGVYLYPEQVEHLREILRNMGEI